MMREARYDERKRERVETIFFYKIQEVNFSFKKNDLYGDVSLLSTCTKCANMLPSNYPSPCISPLTKSSTASGPPLKTLVCERLYEEVNFWLVAFESTLGCRTKLRLFFSTFYPQVNYVQGLTVDWSTHLVLASRKKSPSRSPPFARR